jgi:hypothetical protein
MFPGMSPENQLKLFKTIIQFHPGLLQEGKGSGLGLFISKGKGQVTPLLPPYYPLISPLLSPYYYTLIPPL